MNKQDKVKCLTNSELEIRLAMIKSVAKMTDSKATAIEELLIEAELERRVRPNETPRVGQKFDLSTQVGTFGKITKISQREGNKLQLDYDIYLTETNKIGCGTNFVDANPSVKSLTPKVPNPSNLPTPHEDSKEENV